MKFSMLCPNAPINSESLNITQYYNLFHLFVHKVQEYEKRKNLTGALVRNGLNTYVWSAFEKVINERLHETDMLQLILT